LRGQESERLYESRHRGDDGRGRVTDPEDDDRLRDNRGESYRQYGQRHESDDGRGQVRDPEHDGRLKQNRERGVSLSGNGGSRRYGEESEESGRYRSRSLSSRSRSSTRYDDDGEQQQGGQGRVKDPENDHRLRQNRGR
jgi:hypothetical protein